MGPMSTYGVMADRIGDELMVGGRTDLEPQVQRAIQSAILHYRAHPLWFNRGVKTAATVNGDFTQARPSGLITCDAIRVDHGQGFFDMERAAFKKLLAWRQGSVASGKPYRWAEFAESVYLYPTPDAAYNLEFYGLIDLAALSADGDTNAWMVEGEPLIRQRARALVQIDVLKDGEAKAEALQIAAMGGPGRHCLSLMERAALSELRAQSNRRLATGKVAPG